MYLTRADLEAAGIVCSDQACRCVEIDDTWHCICDCPQIGGPCSFALVSGLGPLLQQALKLAQEGHYATPGVALCALTREKQHD